MTDRAAVAVFVSYAREDSDAARRIAETLRSHGLEVWFDQDELRGGDAWDQKLRRQIKECALFVPVVSANTQERREGYFRLEWKLAAERTHLMAEGVPFIAPVVIDDTKEANALVPAEFMRVQWTRLPGAKVTPAFAEQVQRLLAPAEVARLSRPVRAPNPDAGWPARATPAVTWGLLFAGLLAVAVAVVLTRKSSDAGAGTRPATTEKTATVAPVPAPTGPRLGSKSIAVLPFDNLSEDKEASAAFAAGMHDDMIASLHLIRDLRCVPRTTALAYLGSKKTHREIADELGVAYVLTGTVRRAAKSLRIVGTLLNPRTDETLWVKSYDKTLADAGVIFAIQSELAQSIARELKAALSPEEKRLVERHPTESVAAYDLFLRARELSDGNPAKNRQAEALLNSAVELDPKFAAAWAGLCRAQAYMYFNRDDPTAARIATAKAAMDTVRRLAPESSEALEATAYFNLYALRDFPRAAELFVEVARLRPFDALAQGVLGAVYRRQGRWLEALASFSRARELEPNVIVNLPAQLGTLQAGRRYTEADELDRAWLAKRPDALTQDFKLALRALYATGSVAEPEKYLRDLTPEQAGSAEGLALRKSWAFLTANWAEYLRLDQPARSDADTKQAARAPRSLNYAMLYAAAGDQEKSRASAPGATGARARLASALDNSMAWADVARIEALLGNKEEALRCARKAVELTPESFDTWDGPRISVTLAFVYAWTGDKERAIAEYARLLRVPGDSALNVHVMKRSPEFFPLQGDPRFEALLADPKNNAPLF